MKRIIKPGDTVRAMRSTGVRPSNSTDVSKYAIVDESAIGLVVAVQPDSMLYACFVVWPLHVGWSPDWDVTKPESPTGEDDQS